MTIEVDYQPVAALQIPHASMTHCSGQRELDDSDDDDRNRLPYLPGDHQRADHDAGV